MSSIFYSMIFVGVGWKIWEQMSPDVNIIAWQLKPTWKLSLLTLALAMEKVTQTMSFVCGTHNFSFDHFNPLFTLNFVSFCFVNLQALCGVVFEVPTLGGDKLRISTMQEVIKPNTVKRITGYGLPLPKDPSRKGDMLVAFDIKFPDKLTASEKELLNDVLPSA